jgi:hypothetical protein
VAGLGIAEIAGAGFVNEPLPARDKVDPPRGTTAIGCIFDTPVALLSAARLDASTAPTSAATTSTSNKTKRVSENL